MKCSLLLLLCVFCVLAKGLAQSGFTFEHLTVEDGLLFNSRIKTFQDAEGFYWMASSGGLQRFDGKSFITYKYPYRASTTVTGDWVDMPVEDSDRNIWIRNEEGVSIFGRTTQTFTKVSVPDPSPVIALFKDRQGHIWIMTERSVYLYDYRIKQSVLYTRVAADSSFNLSLPGYDPSRHGFWVILSGAEKRITFFDIARRKWSFPVAETADQLLGHSNPISVFTLDSDGNLWLVNYLGDLCRYDTHTGKNTSYTVLHERAKGNVGVPNSTINFCLDDNKGSVWFAGDYYQGLLRFNKYTGTFAQIPQENGTEYGLHYTEDVYHLSQDAEGNIWVDTDLGLNIFNPNRQGFKYLRQGSPATLTPFSSDVTSITQSGTGDIWITTWGNGVFRYDSNLVLQHNYVHEPGNPTSLGEPLNRTWCTFEDQKGRIWVGGQYAVLSVLDPRTNRFKNQVVPEFQHRTILHIAKGKDNRLWFSLHSAVIGEWDLRSQKFSYVEKPDPKELASLAVTPGVSVDQANNIWWTRGSDRRLLSHQERQTIIDTGLLPKNISFLGTLDDSLIMGGTSGKGFFVWNQATHSIRFAHPQEAIPATVFGAVPVNPSGVWLIVSDGIEKLDLVTGKKTTYTIADGIRDHQFTGSFCRLRNGSIMVAAKSGVIYFNPDSIADKPPPADVQITGFQAAQNSLSVDSLLSAKVIELPYDQNLVTISYSAISMSTRMTDRYFYQLNGVDKNWESVGANRSVTYDNLPPGRYTFAVKAQNADGMESAHTTFLSIHIHPPWWATWWAYLLCASLFTLAAYVLYAYRKENQAAVASIREKIAADLHDDIGSTLNSISVYSEVAGQQLDVHPENARALLQKMGGSARMMIDTMNDIVWTIKPSNDQFENILLRMRYFAGELLSGKNMLLHFDIDEKVKNLKMPMTKRKNYYLIFKEAINNAYKYAQANSVNVRISEEAGHLEMVISDNGIGFKTDDGTLQGNGLKNMTSRAREIGGRLTISSTPGQGTVIHLSIPLK